MVEARAGPDDDTSEGDQRTTLSEVLQNTVLYAAIPTLGGYLPFITGLALTGSGHLAIGLPLAVAGAIIGVFTFKIWIMSPKKPRKHRRR